MVYCAWLLLMLMLARVDGKSPVEYLTEKVQKQTVRDFVAALLTGRVFRLDAICSRWCERLDSSKQE